jgi:hypothetical protein
MVADALHPFAQRSHRVVFTPVDVVRKGELIHDALDVCGQDGTIGHRGDVTTIETCVPCLGSGRTETFS